MATKQWTGSGDWFSTLWLDISTATPAPSGPPQPGDIAYVFRGTLTITAADAASHPTIDGIARHFASLSADIVPTLDITNVAFGAGMVIDNRVNDNSALVIARGTASLGGQLEAGGISGAILTLDIEAAAGVATFTNSGTIEADNTGSLEVIGTADATLDNSGLLLASDGSADIAVPVVSTGTISATETGTLTLEDGLVNSGDVTVVDFGVLSVSLDVANTGTIAGDGGTLALTDVSNQGTIIEAGATATITDDAGGFDNAGQVLDQSGTLVITGRGPVGNGEGVGGVGGSGTISIAAEVDIGGVVSPAQHITFANSDAMLRMSDPADFGATITNMTGHDLIDLQGIIADSTTYDSGTGTLGVFDGTTEIASLLVSGLTGNLGVASDNDGGTILTLEQGGTPAQVTQYMIANSADAGGAHNWPLPDPIITYSFNAASDWTATEQAAFQNAMTLWSDVANVTFEQVASGSPDLLITRASNGEATTASSFENGVNVTSTIAIDTSVPSWQNLSALGTSDPTGFGGYGFQTVLHELGHVMGLNHPGPYNETANITQQIFYTDTHQYSVMSYFDAAESGAVWLAGTTYLSAQTPMLYDISAVQQIYGANTSELTGGDTFGFNSTFGTASVHPLRQYDFTQDTTPVVTLYDGGPNNTLDLSGFSTASTIDLAPGTFSSADGMTDNIAIAYDTTIDSAVGGSGNDLIIANGGDDTIDGGGGDNTVEFSGDLAQYTLQQSGGAITVAGLGATDQISNVATLEFADQSIPAGDASCFVRGTRILTPGGPIAIEALAAGDTVLTRDGRAAPIRWVGRRAVDMVRHPRPWDVRPVRIRADAIAPGVPTRDLLVSPDHALALQGALIPARYLLNGATILPEARATRVLYLHVELDRHDVLLAEGMAAESYLDTGNRQNFAGGPVTRLHADFATRSAEALRIWQDRACAPLLLGGETLTALRWRLSRRAELLGYKRTEDPRLRLFADGRPLATRRDGDWVIADLLNGAADIRVSSRTWVPLHMHPDPEGDARQLGVAVAELRLDGEPVPLDGRRLTRGWHAPEPDGRWTDGGAVIAARSATSLGLRLALTGTYWRDATPARKAARA